MARQPKQVHIFLFRQREGRYEYGMFQRADMPFCWQGVCGGVEEDETFEEAGIEACLPLYPLESISYLPDNIFAPKHRAVWGQKTVVIPMYFFAMEYDGQIKLSKEHTDMKWLYYDEACNKIYYTDQKVALYELNEKLLRKILP